MVSMEQNIGYITAIGSTTMESGEIIGNSLKTIFSRITTLPASITILESVGVAVNEIGEAGEQVRPVGDIMSDLADKWVYLSASQQQNVAVQIAGRNQLSRFLAVMNNHQTAVEATTVALNSQGSAVRENQAYLNSYEANINRMKTAFSGLAQSMGNAFLKSGLSIGIDVITNVTKAISKLIDTFGLLPVASGVLSLMFSRMGGMGKVVDNLFPSILKLKDAILSLNTSAGKADFSSKMTAGLGKIKGAIGGILGTMASMALVTGAIMAVTWAVEKLINKYQEAKAEAKRLKDTQDTMVESYRNSGDSLNKMSDDYDRLYKKYGEFNQAVSSGKIDPQINTEDYELYSKITDELATKLPTVISYTDAQGVSYIKAGDAVKQQVEYAKALSIERAKLETLEIEEKMAEGADKAKDAYKGLLEVQKEMADLEAGAVGEADIAKYDEKATAIEKFFKTVTGQYDGATGWDYVFLNAGFADAEAERQATAEVTSKKMQTYIIDEIEARNKLQSAIADQLTLVKDSGSSYMEAQGHVEKLGSTSQSVVQDFAQMNSGYLDQVVTMHDGIKDLDDRAEAQADSLKERTENLAKSTRLLSDQLNKAYEDGLKNVDMTGTMAEDTVKVEEYGQAFESMVSMIPKSMMTINESTGQLNGEVTNLISNFDGLGKVDDGISDKTMSYSDARIALQEMGVTGKDADQMIRNFAQASGNAQIEASLLASTVDESADSMTSLRDATLDTVDALGAITGVSAENASALSGYVQGISMSKDMFGEAYESSELYGESLAGLATYYGMSEEAVLNNMDSIKLYEEALSAVTFEQDENGNSTVKVAEMSSQAGDLYAQATERMKENGLSLEQNMQMILGLAPDIETAFKSVSDIDFTNTGDETSRLATAFLTAKDGSDELTEAMEKLGETHPDLYTIRDMFTSFSTQISEGTADFDDFRTALEGQLDPPEIDLLIGIMEQITGKEEEVKAKHEETASVLANNPLNLQVKETGVAETEGKVGGLTNLLDQTNGKTSTVRVEVSKEQAQADLDGVINQALELDATEAQITTIVNGAETSGEQITGLANLIEDLSGGSVTANDVLSNLGSAVDTSTASGKVRGMKEEVDGLSTGVKDQITAIQTSIQELNGSFDNVNLGVESIGNLKNTLSDLNSAVDTAKGGVLNSVAQVNTSLSGISGEANPAITAMSNMKNTFNELRDSLSSTAGVLTTAGGGFTSYASSVSSVSYSVNTAKDAINGYSQALATSAGGASIAQSRISALTQAKQAESSAFLASKIIIGSTGGAYTTLAGKSSQTASKINSDSMRIVMAVIRMSNAYKTHVSAISSVIAGMSRSISGSTSSAIGQHNRQAQAIKNLASTARNAKSDIANLNSAISSSMGGMSSFISRAQSTATQADKTRSAVNKMREANSGNGIVGAVRNFIGLSTDRLVTAITGIDTGSAIGSLYSAITSSGATGTMSANAGAETSIGATGGTAGTIKASFYPTADIGMDGKVAFGALANDYSRPEEMEDAYKLDAYERKYASIERALAKVTGQMGRMNEMSASYRKGLADTIKLENQRLALVKKELGSENSRLRSVESQLKRLPAVGKQTIAQRKKYNELQKTYDELLGSITSLTKEQEDLTNSAIENTQTQFESLIDEIVNTYTVAIGKLETTIGDVEFAIELLAYTDPDNAKKQMELLVKQQSALIKKQSAMENQYNALNSKAYSTRMKYGENDARSIYAKEQAVEAVEALRETVLAVKKAEKEIIDIRTEIGEESIDKLKDYYGNMKSLATDAIKAEQDALEKAYEKREKLYDAEIEKIESVYDAKTKSIDDAENEADYQEQMTTFDTDRRELQRQIAVASRDTSLLGKKNLAELQKELVEINKEISDAQKERQAELLKEQLDAQKEAEIKAIEDKKTADEKNTNTKVEDLEKQASDLEKYYDNILDDEKYWDKLQKDVTNGKFAGLKSELEKMYKNIGNMNNGVFDGLLKEFSSFSEQAKAEFIELNKILLKNMQFSGGTNSLNQLKSLSLGKTIPIGTGNNSFYANAGDGTTISESGGTAGTLSASSIATQSVIDKVRNITPKVNVGDVRDVMDSLVSITSGDTNYNLTMPVENFNGTKKERDSVLDKFENEMRKRGK